MQHKSLLGSREEGVRSSCHITINPLLLVSNIVFTSTKHWLSIKRYCRVRVTWQYWIILNKIIIILVLNDWINRVSCLNFNLNPLKVCQLTEISLKLIEWIYRFLYFLWSQWKYETRIFVENDFGMSCYYEQR